MLLKHHACQAVYSPTHGLWCSKTEISLNVKLIHKPCLSYRLLSRKISKCFINKEHAVLQSFFSFNSCNQSRQAHSLAKISTYLLHLGCVYTYFAKAESAFWNADSKRRSKTPFTGVLFMLPSRRRRFREHALRIVRGYCSSSSEPERRLYDVI